MALKPAYSNFLNLIWTLVKGDFRLRYQGSYLGYLWTLFKPLLLFGVIYLVFSVFMPSPSEDYALNLLLGIIIWNFFAESTTTGMASILAKRELITKIFFPRDLIVLAATLTSLITFLLNLVIFAVIYLFSQHLPDFSAFAFLIHIPLLYLFATGLALILASLVVKFQDLQHIWEVLLQIFFWLTPIIYPLSLIPEKYQGIILLNPLARIIDYSRLTLIQHHLPPLNHYLSLTFVCLSIYLLGALIFKYQAKYLAEKI